MSFLKQVSTLLIICSLALVFCLYLSACEGYQRNKRYAQVPHSSIVKGEALAKVHCRSCHAFPEPRWLDAETWNKGVLPQMGPMLGIFEHNFESYPSSINDRSLVRGYYPEQPKLTAREWQHIIDYYTATSPDTLPGQLRRHSIKNAQSLFTPVIPSHRYDDALTSFIKINPDETLPPLIVSDALKKVSYLFDPQLNLVDSIRHGGSIVDMDFTGHKILACNIGVLNPTNGKFGQASYISYSALNLWQEDSISLFDSLSRPVQLSVADLNNDGREDYLLCEFGFLTGSLSWMENRGGGQYTRHVLRALPGAIKAYVQDYNQDSLPDLWVLFAQGDESIFLYTNKGNGTFLPEQVLRFPPVYGSSYFELADFNKDGYSDIVYTCGDNADYSKVLKPYHGVYIFLNDKTNHFRQKFFFPMNGCYKAMARDYDSDGDLDLAAIAYFADYAHQPEEGFVYLENLGGFDFYPYSLPQTQAGRWLTMDAGDLDGDGKIDLVLGNFGLGPSVARSRYDWRMAPPFLVLKNNGK